MVITFILKYFTKQVHTLQLLALCYLVSVYVQGLVEVLCLVCLCMLAVCDNKLTLERVYPKERDKCRLSPQRGKHN